MLGCENEVISLLRNVGKYSSLLPEHVPVDWSQQFSFLLCCACARACAIISVLESTITLKATAVQTLANFATATSLERLQSLGIRKC